jgi:putative nucleotide binding protein
MKERKEEKRKLAEDKEKESRQLYEENGYVLDYLPFGKPGTRPKYRAGAVVQLIGESYFTLLEANVRQGTVLRPLDQVYVGKEARREITYILGRVGYEELTANAKLELENAIEKIVLNREKWFVNFFNTAQPITPRMHALELIPGIGKKYMWDILDGREKKPFSSFEELQNRVNIPSPARLIAKRIIEELSGDSKYRLFTRAS